MSKTSRFFLWVIVVGLAFIAGLRFYRAYEQRAEEEAATAAPTMTFNNVPVQRVSPQAEPQVYERWSGEPAVQEVYLQDAPLDAVQEKEQARQTVASVLSDYKDNPSLQAFYADLRAATGRDDIDLAALSGEGLGRLLEQYPQLQQVIAEHAKDPQFAKTLQEIFSNPQFARSVTILQGGPAAPVQIQAPAR